MIEGNGGRLCEEEGPWLIGLRCCLRHARWGGGAALAAAHPDLSGEIASIVDLAHDSSRRLRPMLSELSLDAAAPRLAAAVEEPRLMLRSGALEWDAHMPGDIDGGISRQTILTGSLFVSEPAANGSMALRELSRRAVDVALLDVDMPVLDGLAAAKEMARLYPSVAVVMLTVFEHEESLARSLALNVRGFLTKDIPSAQLAQLIRQAHAGYSVFGPRPTSILADSYLNSGKNDPKYDAFRERVERLPGYLRTTFDLLIQALPNKTIAKKLGLSEATVRSYISEIFTTLEYTNRGELTITAIKAGY